MPFVNQLKTMKQASSTVLYDASLIATPTLRLFGHKPPISHSALADSTDSPNAGTGRAQVVYFSQKNIKMVLKHYYRGGLVASLLKDKYFGFDVENTRAFKEFRLLKKMQQLGLPVPQAIAAHVEKHLLYFRADLITQEIEHAQTLADYVMKQAADEGIWQKVGACIQYFHQHEVYHSDLNARNILLADKGAESDHIYLIDFDNSYIRASAKPWARSWKLANLARLKRSLLKFKNRQQNFYFDEKDWLALLAGYNQKGN